MKKIIDVSDKIAIIKAALFNIVSPRVSISCQLCHSKSLEFAEILNTDTVCSCQYTCRNCEALGRSYETWRKAVVKKEGHDEEGK